MSKRYVVVLTAPQRHAIIAALENTYADPSEKGPSYEAGMNAHETVRTAASFGPIERATRTLCSTVDAGEIEPVQERAVATIRRWLGSAS